MLSLLSLSSCFRSILPPIEHPAGVHHLLTIPDIPMTLRVAIEQPTASVGHQFLLGILPVTRVYSPHIEREISTYLAIEAATRRYKLIHEASGAVQPFPHLLVTVSELQISGYDLVVLRRPVASVKLTALLDMLDRSPRRCEITANSSRITQFAFSTELNQVLQEALASGVHELFDCLLL